MGFIIFKYAVTAGIIVLVSEVAKRSDRLGALIASLPFVTILAMCWMFVEKQSTEKLANHAFYTFWFVFPTLPMFLVMPWLLRQGWNFWLVLLAGALTTFLCFWLADWFGKTFFDVELIPGREPPAPPTRAE
jgi:uncharacterized membrane protein (GlpM family)